MLSGMYDNAVKGMQKYMMRKGSVPDSEGLELAMARPCQVIWEVQHGSLPLVKGLCLQLSKANVAIYGPDGFLWISTDPRYMVLAW